VYSGRQDVPATLSAPPANVTPAVAKEHSPRSSVWLGCHPCAANGMMEWLRQLGEGQLSAVQQQAQPCKDPLFTAQYWALYAV
jgi:hypothetical protein